MSSYAAGSLKVLVTAETAGVSEKIQRDSTAAGEKGGKSAGKSWGSNFLSTVGVAMAALGAEKIFSAMVEGGQEAAQINKATAAVIKSTGGAAHVTAGRVAEVADAIMKKTGVESDSIKSGENMLLTFRNIRDEAGRNNNIFDQTTSVLTDMTAAMTGGHLTTDNMRKTAIQLGKALNDPVKGMGALTRVGVQFTEKQKEQITAMVKSGNTLGAQRIILKELNTEFGGAAAAYATPMTRLHTAMHELAIQGGTVLLPMLNSLATWLTSVGIPALEAFGGWLARNKAWVVPLVGALSTFVVTLVLASKAISIATAAARLFGITLDLSLGPVFLVIAGLAALGVGLYLLWTRSRTFRVIVEAAFYGVRNAAMAVIGWFAGPFTRFFTVVIPGVFESVLRWVKANWPLIVGFLTGPIGIAVVLIIRYWTQIRTFITNTVNAIWHIITSVFNSIRSFIGGTATAVQRTVAGWWNNIVSTVSGALGRAWSNLSGWFGRLPGQIASWAAGAVRAFSTAGGSMISGMLSGIANAMRNIAGWINRVIVQPVVGAVKRFFGIHSPSTVMEGVGENLVTGLFRGLEHDAGHLVSMVFGGWPAALGGLIGKGFASLTALPGKALHALAGVAGKISGWFSGLFGGGGGPAVGSGVAAYRGMVTNIATLLGVPDMVGTILAQMQTESGGNAKAINLWDSNAKAGTPSMGLMQVIQPTFDAFAGPFAGLGIWNPFANIYAAVAYAIARYGRNFSGVLGHGHGYAAGGIVHEPVAGIGLRTGMPYSFGEKGPELVSPLTRAHPKPGGATVINIYPRESQSETAIAAAVNANLSWAAAGGLA
jgi:hypothetical protein